MMDVFDTNIIIDCLNGVGLSAKYIDASEHRAISRITWIEVLVGNMNASQSSEARSLLAEFELLEITPTVAEQAIEVRKNMRLKLPDALIYASAIEIQGKLVTRNIKDFPESIPQVRVPYML